MEVLQRSVTELFQQDGDGDKSKKKTVRILDLVYGKSGTGKTALAMQAKKYVKKRNGFFISGKFDLQQMDEPYAAIKLALTQLCKNLLAASSTSSEGPDDTFGSSSSSFAEGVENQLDAIQEKMQLELDKELRTTLVRVMPELRHLVGDEKDIPEQVGETNYKESSDLLKYAYRRFIQVLSDFAPLVLLVDDCQWIDKASLDLLQSWLSDSNGGQLLVLVCYRSNEVTNDHILLSAIEAFRTKIAECKKNNSNMEINLIHDIEVEDLSVEDVNEMLVELMNLPTEQLSDLAKLVHQRTNGNVFFVIHFLKTMTSRSLLSFNLGVMKWTWDVDAVRRDLGAEDNVADLLKEKLRNSPVAHRIMPAAACLGCRFDMQTLLLVLNDSDDPAFTVNELKNCLKSCQEDGFLELVNDGNYRFIHDRIEEASLDLLSETELLSLKSRIGNTLLDSFQGNEPDQKVFTAVNLLNVQAGSKINDTERQIKIAKLNLLAGKKAMKCSAFEAATAYLRKSVDLLTENHWHEHTKLSVEAYSLAALAEYCCGNFDKMKEYCEVVLRQDHVEILDKVVAYHALMDGAMASYDQKGSIRYGVELVSSLGMRVPQSGIGIKLSSMRYLIRSKLGMNKKAVERIETIPISTDQTEYAMTKTLDKLTTACFLRKPELLPVMICEMDRRMTKKGMTPYSALAYSLLGIIFNGVLEDFDGGRICGEKAVAVMKRCGVMSVEPRCRFICNTYIFHWKKPLQQCRQNLLEAYRVGMKTGDLDSACFALYHYLEAGLFTGQLLDDLDADFRVYTRQMLDYNMIYHWKISSFCWQALANLRIVLQTGDPTVLTGEVYNEEVELEQMHSEGDIVVEANFRRIQMLVSGYFASYQKAADIAITWGEKSNALLPGQPGCVEVLFIGSLSCFAICSRTREGKKYRDLGIKFAKKLKGWMEKGNPNCVAHDALLDAEKSRALGSQSAVVSKLYETATLLAGRRGLIHVQALANERFASFLLEQQNREDGSYRLKESLNLYTEWGAMRKVEMLQENYGDFIGLANS